MRCLLPSLEQPTSRWWPNASGTTWFLQLQVTPVGIQSCGSMYLYRNIMVNSSFEIIWPFLGVTSNQHDAWKLEMEWRHSIACLLVIAFIDAVCSPANIPELNWSWIVIITGSSSFGAAPSAVCFHGCVSSMDVASKRTYLLFSSRFICESQMNLADERRSSMVGCLILRS